MSELSEFLLARIAEDVADIANIDGVNWTGERVLAECEAKRWIIGQAIDAHEAADRWTDERLRTDTRSPLPEWSRRDAYAETLRALALPYADHADYREEWTPWARRRA